MGEYWVYFIRNQQLHQIKELNLRNFTLTVQHKDGGIYRRGSVEPIIHTYGPSTGGDGQRGDKG